MIRILSIAALVCSLAATAPAEAQIPDSFENLKVLPKDIEKGEIVSIMRGFASALGTRCNHCHVGPDDLQGMDFATDEKLAKKVAREMLRMTNAINDEHLATIDTGRELKVEVSCITCHKHLEIPRQIGEIIQETYDRDGFDAAKKQYAVLREEHHGKGSYDFGPSPLGQLAENAFRARKNDDAFAFVRYTNELFPNYPYSRTLEARFHRILGQKEQALAAFEEALKRLPGDPWIQSQIEALEDQK